jgi:hypothetical protein
MPLMIRHDARHISAIRWLLACCCRYLFSAMPACWHWLLISAIAITLITPLMPAPLAPLKRH